MFHWEDVALLDGIYLLIVCIQFLAFGCIGVIPIIKWYLKDTNMVVLSSEEEFTATEVHDKSAVDQKY